MRPLLPLLAFLLLAPAVLAAANVSPPLPTTGDAVVNNAQGWLGRTTSWSEDVGSGAGENLWTSANVPAELTADIRRRVRWIEILHDDATDATIPVCVRLGPATDSPALACAVGGRNGRPLLSYGAGQVLGSRQPTDQSAAAATVVPLWARAQSGTVTVTVTVGWTP